jgi:NADPH:quinone reductase-like Zn-dependent oxidoreductase
VGGYCVQVANAFGAKVVAIDVDADKLAAVASHGAALTLNARELVELESKAKEPLELWIGGKLVGHMKVNALGRARLVKSTQTGQSVPASVAGKAVKIRTSAGTLVASGRF